MLDEGTWGREPEVVTFSELYNLTVNIYERFASQTPDNRYVAEDNAPEIIYFIEMKITMILFLWRILINMLGHLKVLK